MYKDKEKQKEAARKRQQRRRDAQKAKGVTECYGRSPMLEALKAAKVQHINPMMVGYEPVPR